MEIKNAIIGLGVASGIVSGVYICVKKINNDFVDKFKKSSRSIVGTVLREGYQNTLIPNPEYDGFVSHSNETVKLESKYTLKIKTDDGRILGVSIVDAGTIKKEALDAIIDEGTKISFPTGNWESPGKRARGETYFTQNTQVGTKRADRITVLE